MRQSLRWLGRLVFVVFICVGGFVGYVALSPPGPDPLPPVSGAPAGLTDTVARGEYLARAADCVACHTAPGGKAFAGGLPFKLPFGTIYATNITPDKETGIGGWSDDDFVRAVRQGVSPHGNLYPAMPYTSYTAMSRDDVLAIKAFLLSQQPVRQVNMTNDLRFPFNQRWGMQLWNLAYFRDRRMQVDAAKGAQWNRGAYLATALGHCAECHTPRDFGYGLTQSKALAGEEVQGWFAGNITADAKTGIGNWSDDQLTSYLTTGHAEGRSSAAGPMAEVIENSLQYMSVDDIKALTTYLRGTAAVATDEATAVNLTPKDASASSAILPADSSVIGHDLGATLFSNDCVGCHQWNGVGRQTPYASLSGSTSVNDPKGRNVVQIILKGSHIAIGRQHEVMPAFGERYSDDDVAALANFVLKQFGDKSGSVTKDQVARQRRQ